MGPSGLAVPCVGPFQGEAKSVGGLGASHGEYDVSGEGTGYALPLGRKLLGENEAHMFLSAGAISCLVLSAGSNQGSLGFSAVRGKESRDTSGRGLLLMASQQWPGGVGFVFSGGSTARPEGFWPTTPGLRLTATGGGVGGPGGLPWLACDGLAKLEPATAAE